YALVLISALLHATWNALVKRSVDPSATVHAVVAAAGMVAAALAALQLALGAEAISPRAATLAAIAGALEAGYFQTLGRALAASLGGAAYRRSLATAVRAAPGTTLGAGAICAAAFLLFMVALARGGAGYVFTLRNTSVLWATVLAFAIGDRPGRRQLGGAAL